MTGNLNREVANRTVNNFNDRVAFLEQPSEEAVTQYKLGEQRLRQEGQTKQFVNQMLYTGTSGFALQKQLSD